MKVSSFFYGKEYIFYPSLYDNIITIHVYNSEKLMGSWYQDHYNVNGKYINHRDVNNIDDIKCYCEKLSKKLLKMMVFY